MVKLFLLSPLSPWEIVLTWFLELPYQEPSVSHIYMTNLVPALSSPLLQSVVPYFLFFEMYSLKKRGAYKLVIQA